MRTTATIDDDLFNQALELTGPNTKTNDLIRKAFETYVRVEAAKRLSALGGAAPKMKDIPRRRSEIEK